MHSPCGTDVTHVPDAKVDAAVRKQFSFIEHWKHYVSFQHFHQSTSARALLLQLDHSYSTSNLCSFSQA